MRPWRCPLLKPKENTTMSRSDRVGAGCGVFLLCSGRSWVVSRVFCVKASLLVLWLETPGCCWGFSCQWALVIPRLPASSALKSGMYEAKRKPENPPLCQSWGYGIPSWSACFFPPLRVFLFYMEHSEFWYVLSRRIRKKYICSVLSLPVLISKHWPCSTVWQDCQLAIALCHMVTSAETLLGCREVEKYLVFK